MDESEFPFRGVSNAVYTYRQTDLKGVGTIPRGPGCFLFTSGTGPHIAVIYAGRSQSIANLLASTDAWRIARTEYGADTLWTHLVSDPEERQREQKDVVEREHPPMNAVYKGDEEGE